MNWSERKPTFLMQMYGPALVGIAENAQTNTAPGFYRGIGPGAPNIKGEANASPTYTKRDVAM